MANSGSIKGFSGEVVCDLFKLCSIARAISSSSLEMLYPIPEGMAAGLLSARK